MITVQHFEFSPFAENTFVLFDETKQCIIIDPGCYQAHEKEELKQYIAENGLSPVRLLNTHCHIDHIFGNKFVSEEWKLPLEMHEADLPTLNMQMDTAQLYNIPGVEESPQPEKYLNEGDVIEFGNSKLDILFTPGHAPGHVVFVCNDEKFVVAGDVLFYGSIGRTDLPGGDHETLISSIKNKVLPLGDEYTVYCGHGPKTNIGFERQNNPFLR